MGDRLRAALATMKTLLFAAAVLCVLLAYAGAQDPEAFDEVSTPRFTRASNGLFAPIHRTTRTVLVSLTTPLFTRGREGSEITTLATRSSPSKVSQSSELREQSTTPAAASSLIASFALLALGTVVAMLMQIVT